MRRDPKETCLQTLVSSEELFVFAKMNRYSTEDRVFLVKTFYLCDQKPAETLRKWSSAFKNRPKPSSCMLKALIDKFERTGSVADDKVGMKTKRKTARTPENITAAKTIMEEEPSTSTRHLAQQLDVSAATAWRIARKDLDIFPYKIQLGQPLGPDAVEKRLEFANNMCDMIDTGFKCGDIVFSDEAHFWLDGYVNRQNYRIWGSEKPDFVVVKPLHPQKVTVWCGLCADGILGPYFFVQTVNSERYLDFLRTRFIPDAYHENWIQDTWFQQDGAPPHSTGDILDLLRSHYDNRVIARGFPNRFGDGLFWPPYSPDLSPLDFFLWGYVKDQVYRDRPNTIEQLKTAITSVIRSIPTDLLKQVIASFERRIRFVISSDGKHFEKLIF